MTSQLSGKKQITAEIRSRSKIKTEDEVNGQNTMTLDEYQNREINRRLNQKSNDGEMERVPSSSEIRMGEKKLHVAKQKSFLTREPTPNSLRSRE